MKKFSTFIVVSALCFLWTEVRAQYPEDIPTQSSSSITLNSTDYCIPEPTITIEVPEGFQIAELQVSYNMTAQNGAFMNEQRSFIYSPTLNTGETTLTSGTGFSQGTYNYNRSVEFAYGAEGVVDFVLRAWRTWSYPGYEGCNTYNNYVVGGTWILTPVFEPINCVKPINLLATATGMTTANLSWTSSGTLFDIEYGEAGFTPTGFPSIGHSGVTNPHSLSELIDSVNYEYYVRQDCGTDGVSSWAGPYSFHTGYCPTSSVLSGYRINGFSTTGGYTNISNENNGVTNAYNNYSVMTVTQSLGGMFNYSVSVPAWTNVEIWVDIDQNMIFDPSMELLASYEYQTSATTFTGSMTIPVGIIPPGDYRMRVRSRYYNNTIATPCGEMNYGETEDYTLSVIPIPTCLPPSNSGAMSLNANSAKLFWASTGTLFDIEWGTAGFTPTGTPTISGVGNPYILTTPSQGAYDFYVRQDCGTEDGTSMWAGPYTIAVGAYSDGDIPTQYNTAPNVNSASDCSDAIITIDVPAGMQIASLQVSYSMTAQNGALMSEQRSFIYSPTLEMGETSFTNGVGSNAGTMNYSRSMNFANGATGTLEFALRAWRTFGNTSPNDGCSTYYNKVDNETWVITPTFEPLPPCPKPLALTADVISYNEAILSWMSSGSSFDIEYGLTGFTPTGVASDGYAGITTTSTTLTGLTPDTNYQFYVRQDCGDDDTSLWAGPFNFYTGYCQVSTTWTVDYISAFSTTGAVENVSYTATSQPAGSYSNQSTQIVEQAQGLSFDFSSSYVGGGQTVNIWIDWNNDMTFDNTTESDEKVYSFYATAATQTGTIQIPVTVPVGEYRMRVRAQWGSGANPPPCGEVAYGSTIDFTLSVIPAPSCMPPVGLTVDGVTFTTADISWTSDGDLFDVEWGVQGFTPTGTPTTGFSGITGTSVSLTDLTAETYYQYYVRQDCGTDGGGESTWSGPFYFETLDIDCPISTIWNGAEWSNGEPDTDTKAIIDGNLVVSSDLTACKLKITINGSLTIPANRSLTIKGQVINNSEASNFVVESDGILVQIDDVDNEGVITVKRESSPMFRLDYTLWSSPVEGMLLKNFSDISPSGGYGTLWNRVYELGAAAWEQVWATQPNFDTDNLTFDIAKGYLYRAKNDWVARDSGNPAEEDLGIFTGVPNNGNVNIATPLAFNAVGNPYPSPVKAEDFLAQNPGTLYFWTNVNASNGTDYTNNNWAYYVAGVGGTGVADVENGGTKFVPKDNMLIQPGQGFVIGTEESNVSFDNSMRTATNGDFFKMISNERHRFWLNLSNEEITFNQILVGYLENATQGIDNGIDAKMFAYEGNAVYSLIENSEEKFVIQGRELPFTDSDMVPLGFRAVNAGSFSISLNNFDGIFEENVIIYLKDNFNQSQHNLNSGAYTFVSEEGTFDTRFEVVYQTTMSVETPDLNSNWIVFKQGDKFQILTQGFDMKAVQVFDMLGRTVYASTAEGTTHSITRIDANQVLIVKITTAEGEVLTKKVQN